MVLLVTAVFGAPVTETAVVQVSSKTLALTRESCAPAPTTTPAPSKMLRLTTARVLPAPTRTPPPSTRLPSTATRWELVTVTEGVPLGVPSWKPRTTTSCTPSSTKALPDAGTTCGIACHVSPNGAPRKVIGYASLPECVTVTVSWYGETGSTRTVVPGSVARAAAAETVQKGWAVLPAPVSEQ